MAARPFPTYAELARPDETGLPLANGVWGSEDQLGMLNNATPATAAAAAKLVTDGRRFNLDLPLDVPFGLLPPGTHPRRRGPQHTVYKYEAANLGLPMQDDKLDDFFLQGRPSGTASVIGGMERTDSTTASPTSKPTKE